MVITMIDTKYKIKSKKNDIFPFINGIIMVLFVIVTLYPVLNTLAISLNDGTDALRGGIYLWPRKFTWKNYTTVLHKDNLITGAYITVARTLIGTLLSLAANAILAFIVSRKRFLFLVLFPVPAFFLRPAPSPCPVFSPSPALSPVPEKGFPECVPSVPAFSVY